MPYIIEKVNETQIVKQQLADPEKDVFTGMSFDNDKTSISTLENNKSLLGIASEDNPSEIDIYAKDFDSKEKLQDFIKNYNDEVTALAGIHKINVIIIPIAPDTKPSIRVSALNTLDTSFFDAPILLKTPISFVLSRTEMYVIIPIIIDETTREIATNAIKTEEIAVIIVLTDDIRIPT